jgi:hypothetical protein
MSDEGTMTAEQEAQELEQMQQLLAQEAEAKKAKAADAEPISEPPTPSPEPIPSPAPEVAPEPTPPVTPTPQASKPEDDPMEWAKKKGLKTPEDMVRALQQKEQEFHKRNQAGHPGYQDLSKDNHQPLPPPQWQPRPEMGGYQQPPPGWGMPRSTDREREIAARLFPELNPDDAKVFVPAMFEVANAAARQVRADMQQQYAHIERATSRNNELMTLMQDPAYRDVRVQQEIDRVTDSDPSIFERERFPHVAAFNQALANLARKQLQQGIIPENQTPSSKPPFTAGGGNGSANTAPQRITQEVFDTWSVEEMDAYIKSGGKKIPKR